MTNETETVRRGGLFVPVLLPWLLGGGMFAVYFLTLYHVASPASLGRLADVSGWNWRPQVFAPLTFLATYPVRWLPDHLKLPALNLFAAGCAGLVLLLLARSVALLPHNQTNEQRQREQSEFGLLSIPFAWVPPLFAVLVCGLQISFWERAVEFVDRLVVDSGEMFNLVLFAYVVRCLLEFRISRRESWLTRCAIVYGLGMANNWAMIGFLPVFLVALVWMKGFDFFQWRFLVRMLACGLAGLALLFLMPAIVAGQHVAGYGFAASLREVLSIDRLLLLHGLDRRWLLLLSLTSLVPMLMMGIRWATSFGDNSPLGVVLATGAMTVAHGFLLACCLWVTLDPPFGPRQLVLDTFARVPLLTFYYLGALSIGYFAGYFLLVFGSRPIAQRQRTRPAQRWFNRTVFALVCLVIVAVPAALAFKNLARIQEGRNLAAATDNYFAKIEQALPAKDAVILSDVPAMLYALQAHQARQKVARNDLFIDTAGVAQSWRFVSMLDQKHPQDNPGAIFTDRTNAAPLEVDCIHLLENLATRHDIYYLQPSFGYYFERFYQEPRGLVYQLTEFPTNDWAPPPLSTARIAENRAFWRDTSNEVALLIRTLKPARSIASNTWERFAKDAFFAPETNGTAVELAQIYSRALDSWGVALQRTAAADDAQTLREAGECFDVAQQLNPQNGPALVNLEFNRDLRQHIKPAPVQTFEEKLPGNYLHWYEVVKEGGPFDSPDFCAGFGLLLRQGRNFRQAIQQFQRVETLMPDDPRPPMLLAQTYFAIPSQNPLLYYAFPSPGACLFDASAAAGRVLRIAPAETNAMYLKTLCQFDLGTYLQVRTNDASRPFTSSAGAYAASLAMADQVLWYVTNDVSTLSMKGLALMQLKRYGEAIPVWSYFIATQSNTVPIYLTRAIAYFQSQKFAAAKADYETVVKAEPRAYQAYFGLGEIAWTNRNYPEALTNYELYLSTARSNAPAGFTNGPEFTGTEARVKELEHGRP